MELAGGGGDYRYARILVSQTVDLVSIAITYDGGLTISSSINDNSQTADLLTDYAGNTKHCSAITGWIRYN